KTELDPFNVILIGDNYEADIIGSANKGIDSIWINTKNQIIEDKTIKPKYEISELVQLTEIL
ncbi:MAG: HAD hydrolase-like protein, partial [Candidatus Dadabacteria bacterium]|nr:HAD hydrolase-like protein [Candidatus Dadabacteria bacterium]NIQ14544.1 HAD hydrolase-like protein [Candidatus Dadabacteria bacterium]